MRFLDRLRTWFRKPETYFRREYLSLVHDHAGLIVEARTYLDLSMKQRAELNELRCRVASLEQLRIQAAINLSIVVKKLEVAQTDCAKLADIVEALQNHDYKPVPPAKSTLLRFKVPDHLPEDI